MQPDELSALRERQPLTMTIPKRIDGAWQALAGRVAGAEAPAVFLAGVQEWLRSDLPPVSSRMSTLVLARPALRALLEHRPEAFSLSNEGFQGFRRALAQPCTDHSPAAFVAAVNRWVAGAITAVHGRCHDCGVGTLLVSYCPGEDRLYLVCDDLGTRFTLELEPSGSRGDVLPATIEQMRRLGMAVLTDPSSQLIPRN